MAYDRFYGSSSSKSLSRLGFLIGTFAFGGCIRLEDIYPQDFVCASKPSVHYGHFREAISDPIVLQKGIQQGV